MSKRILKIHLSAEAAEAADRLIRHSRQTRTEFVVSLIESHLLHQAVSELSAARGLLREEVMNLSELDRKLGRVCKTLKVLTKSSVPLAPCSASSQTPVPRFKRMLFTKIIENPSDTGILNA